jgi:hypothetical protein
MAENERKKKEQAAKELAAREKARKEYEAALHGDETNRQESLENTQSMLIRSHEQLQTESVKTQRLS